MPANYLTARDVETIRRNPLLSGLPTDAFDAVLREAHVVEIPRAQILFLRGEPAKWFYLVLDGWVKIFRDTQEGDQTVITVTRPGETLAEAAIFFGADYPASAEVVENARLLKVPASALIGQIQANGELALRILGSMSVRMRILISDIEQLQARSTSQRLGNFLLSLATTQEGATAIKLPYDKSLIAARLGMKPESLSRAFAKLKPLGVVSEGSVVRVADLEELADHCRAEAAT